MKYRVSVRGRDDNLPSNPLNAPQSFVVFASNPTEAIQRCLKTLPSRECYEARQIDAEPMT